MVENVSRQELIADEIFMLTDGGEMPEVAFHSAVYYLTKDKDGPRLELSPAEEALLQEAVVRRYTAIVLRDLSPENKNKAIYRGVKRSAANWQRLKSYAQRQHIDISLVRAQAGQALLDFIRHEYDAVVGGGGDSCLNCSEERLVAYADSLGVVLESAVPQWRQLF